MQTTEAGDRVVERARTIIDEVYAEVLGTLPEPERTVLLDALVRLVGPDGPLGAPGSAPPATRRRSARSMR